MNLLSSNPGKIRPLVMPKNTTLPAVVYHRSFNLVNTKDGHSFGEATVTISVFTSDYLPGIELSEIIREALTRFRDSEVKEIRLLSGTESFIEEAFMQTLVFSVKGIL